ncbi:MAG: hypothetical protein JWQ43_852, partial [Glaciihabitans sp.]|nr:hypothetical protein [Glaciihabitans sp.]
VVSELRVNSFLDYLYFTDYEIEDPSQYLAAAVVPCSKYAYAGRPTGNFTAGGTTTSCHNIAFGDKDLLTGPVHSNDLIRACSAEFAGPVTTAATRATPTSPLYSSVDSTDKACPASTFRDPASPSSIAPVVMPATNTSLKLQTRTDLAAVTSPGCLYSGPTDIVFNSNGTVTVRSPWTKATRVSGSPATGGTAAAACGVVGPTGLGSVAGSTFAVPDHNVMYVQEVPAVFGDPNYYAAGSVPLVGTATGTANLSCTGASHQANGNGLGYPMKDEIAPTTTSYGCRSGDAFVRGVLNGAVTVATSNFLYVTGDTTYAPRTQAVLGLVGDGAVFVWNPVNSAGASLLNDDSLGPDRGNGRTIHAAILSVAHTFQVQGHTTGGARGTLTIVGAIAQKYRGIVRSGDIGYVKNYSYDLRFSYLTPPKYLMPVSTTYGVIVWIEVSAAFTRTGAAR